MEVSHAALLTHVIEEEYRVKCDNARQQRLRRARIPEPWTMETFPFARQPKLNRKAVMALYDTMDFIPKAQNIIWLGGTGVGKTGLATSFLVHAIQQGCSGRCVLFADRDARSSRGHNWNSTKFALCCGSLSYPYGSTCQGDWGILGD